MKNEIINAHSNYISNLISESIFSPAPSKYYLTDFNYSSDLLFEEISNSELIVVHSIVGDEEAELEKDKYKLFSVNGKICISFNHLGESQRYSITVRKDGVEESIQLQNFESIDRYLRMGRDHQWGAFVFLDSCAAIDQTPDYNGGPSRCDLRNYGPHGWGPNGSSIGSNSMPVGDKRLSAIGDKLAEFESLINVPRFGHICYIRMRDMIWGNNNIYGMELPFTARTLPEMFKIICEWSAVTEEPWNNTQDIAVKAKGFIKSLSMPSDVYNSVSQNQADMHIFRYLNGNTEARLRPDISDIVNFDNIVIDWLRTKFTYSQFENMINVNPRSSGW